VCVCVCWLVGGSVNKWVMGLCVYSFAFVSVVAGRSVGTQW
jgi:hypothetical protein